MEIQKLRLQLLGMANGDIDAAKAMEAYVLSVGAADKVDADKGPENKECGCPACVLRKIIELRLEN
ncbi:hypothetical protein [Acinetobacter sp. SA01]|uniref:hypothetical protein n=1 Tax=Acinetobacter sp. SA01 TaxID=1862567 RepID=UPI0014085A5D|nr:hypothetical protein [Acinetobacter sp. SA01]